MNLQLTGGAARCVTTTPGGLLPRLFTLTATSAAVILCHLNPTVTRSFPLRNVMLCVARTFLSQPCVVNERQAAILFLRLLGHKITMISLVVQLFCHLRLLALMFAPGNGTICGFCYKPLQF